MACLRRSSVWSCAWALPRRSAQVQRVRILLLEAKSRGELYEAFALLLRRVSEQRCIQQAGAPVEAEAEIGAGGERPQRMIQEVVGVGPELESLLFRDREI